MRKFHSMDDLPFTVRRRALLTGIELTQPQCQRIARKIRASEVDFEVILKTEILNLLSETFAEFVDQFSKPFTGRRFHRVIKRIEEIRRGIHPFVQDWASIDELAEIAFANAVLNDSINFSSSSEASEAQLAEPFEVLVRMERTEHSSPTLLIWGTHDSFRTIACGSVLKKTRKLQQWCTPITVRRPSVNRRTGQRILAEQSSQKNTRYSANALKRKAKGVAVSK